jgi:hypothetical protein
LSSNSYLYLAVFGIVPAVFPQSALMDRVFNDQIDPQFRQKRHPSAKRTTLNMSYEKGKGKKSR